MHNDIYAGLGSRAIDFIEAAQRAKRRVNLKPAIAAVQAWPVAPDEWLSDCDRNPVDPEHKRQVRQVLAKYQRLLEKYPGFVPGAWPREDMKYGRAHGCIDASTPLAVVLFHYLLTALSHWSRDLLDESTRDQFVDYLPRYVEREDWPDRFGPGAWADARRLVARSLDIPANRLALPRIGAKG